MSLSKVQIITALSNLPLAKLQSLYNYSTNIVIPDDELLTNVNMQQMVTKSKSLAATYFPEWTDWSDSDWGRFIVELIALFSEKDFYYINGFANETFLSKAIIYSDVFVRAAEFGYTPRVWTSSILNANVTFPAGNAYVYPVGTLTIVDSNGLSFTNNSIINITATGTVVMSVPLYAAKTIKKNVIYNGYRIDLVEKNIDQFLLHVYIGGTEWTRVNNFGFSTATDTHYIAIPEVDGSCSIYFGNNVNGMAPAVDTLVVCVYFSSVSYEDISVGALTVQKSELQRPATIATLVNFVKGYVGESLEELRYNALLYKSTYNIVNDIPAVEAFLLAQDEIKRASAQVIGNNVIFRVFLKTGLLPSIPQYSNWTTLLSGIVTMGFFPSYIVYTTVNAGPIAADVYYLANADASLISESCKNLISDYTNPLILADFGKDFNRNDLLFLLRSAIPAVQNVVFTTVQGGAPVDIVLDKTQILEQVATGYITLNMIPV